MMATENSFLDDILNFSGDEDDEGVPVGGDQHRYQQQELSELSSFESSESHQNLLNIFKHYDSIHVGEELEWVSSFLDDSSLALETSDSGQQKQQQQQQQRQEPEKKTHQFSKQQNPVSMLGSSMEPCLFRAGLVIPARARSKRMRAPSTSVSSLWCEAIRVPNKREKPRRCGHCGVEKTPQWRTGPLGPKTLCNACGVRYKSGRLLPEYRPAGSPSFSSDLHSNCHRKIVEMRRQKQQQQVVL